MKLARQQIDLGLFTNNEGVARFWRDDVGLPYAGLLKPGGGIHQHRHDMNGSILKVMNSRDPVPTDQAPGISELLIARPNVAARLTLVDPDGNRVTLVPPGTEGVTGIGVRLNVRDDAASVRFYRDTLGCEQLTAMSLRLGESVILLESDPGRPYAGEMKCQGYRVITILVEDAEEEHSRAMAFGASEGAPMVHVAGAKWSFIRDPDGTWIELAQVDETAFAPSS